MAAAAGEHLKLEQFDVKNAFTQSDIDSEIYVEPAKGFETKGKDGKVQVLKLIKSLYGTKQASRLWQLKLRDHLVNKMGFTNSLSDPCLFSKREGECVMLIGVYVDDIVLAHKNADVDKFINDLFGPDGFEGKHLGKLSWFLGMGITQHEDFSITIDQELFVKKLTQKFLLGKRHARTTPCDPIAFQKLKPADNDLDRDRASRLPYLQLIGSLLYLSTMTRPDIAYHMSVLCSLMHDHTVEAAAKYLRFWMYESPLSGGGFTPWTTRERGSEPSACKRGSRTRLVRAVAPQRPTGHLRPPPRNDQWST